VLDPPGPHALGRDRLDTRRADVDESHVRAVVGGVVAGIHAQPLAADDVGRAQQLRDLRILDDLADLPAHEPGGGRVGFRVQHQVAERPHEGQAAFLPTRLVLAAQLLRRRLPGRCGVGMEGDAVRHRLAPFADRRIVRLGRARHLGIERRVVGRDGVVRGPLEHRQVVGLPGDDRDRLDGRRAGADDPDPHAGEVHAAVRPLAGVVGRAPETVAAGEVGGVRGRQAAGRHHAPGRGHPVAGLGLQHPAPPRLVEDGGGHPGVEADVPAEVEAVGDVLGVAQDLGLRGVFLAPCPLLLEFLVELVGVLDALDVAPGPRIAVPVPGPADPAAGLEHRHRQAHAAQPVQHVHAGEAGPDDHHVGIAIGHGRELPFQNRTGSLAHPDRHHASSGTAISEHALETPANTALSSGKASDKMS